MGDSPEATPEGEVSDEEKPAAPALQSRSAWARGPPKSLFDDLAQPITGSAGSSKDRAKGGASSSAKGKGRAAMDWSKGSLGDWSMHKGGSTAAMMQKGGPGAAMSSKGGYSDAPGWSSQDYDPRSQDYDPGLGTGPGFDPGVGKGPPILSPNPEYREIEGQMWPPPNSAQGRGRSGFSEIADGESVLWPPPAQDHWGGAREQKDPAYFAEDPFAGSWTGKGMPHWMLPAMYTSKYADAWGQAPRPESALQASAKQIIDAFCRLDGPWRGFGAYRQRQWHEVILEPVIGDPEQTRLVCRTWTDGREGEQRKMIYYSEGHILFGNGQIYLDTIGPRRAIWKDWNEPDMEWQWLRGW